MQEPKSITGRIGAGGKRVVDSIVRGLASLHIHPNILTLIGMVINIFAMILFAKGIFSWAGLVILFAGIFDIVDGEVARRTKRETKFGAFFDSVIDRYSDLLLLLGLIIWYAKINRIFYVGLTGLVLIGSVLTSYSRARAESLIPACKVGFLERPERIVLLIIGSFGSDGGSPVGDGHPLQLDRVSADLVHVARAVGARAPAAGYIFMTRTSLGIFSSKTESGMPVLSLIFENFKIM